MASIFSYTFDLSSEKKFLKFKGECGEEYILFHELSWTIYGNSILNLTIESNIERNILIVAELHSHNTKSVKTTALLEDGRADLNFQNVNLLTSDPWRCIFRIIPHLQLQDVQESAAAMPSVMPFKKGAIKKSKLEQLSADFQRILSTAELSDVVLSDGVNRISAHKVILSARSPVFARMFQHPMKENNENCVKISDIPEDVLKELVYFMYTGTVTLRDARMARNLYIAADKYQVTDLRKVCSEILQNVSFDEVLDTLALADLYEDMTLKQSALEFISKNYSLVKNSNSWESFTKENQALAIEILSFIIENKV